MKSPEVYFADLREGSNSPFNKISRLMEKISLNRKIKEDALVAVKTHLGEEGSVRYIRPTYIRRIVDEIKAVGGNPFVTDTTALYPGARFNAVDNLQTASHNGFTGESVNAPVIIADGLRGYTGSDVKVKGKYLSKVSVAVSIAEADFVLVVSHFKLHEFAGIGGAIKNLGMGCVTKNTKSACHKVNRPYHTPESCKVCKECIDNCEYDVISVKNKKIVFDRDKCMGCLACYFCCSHDSWELPKNIRNNLQRALAESALGVTKAVGPKNFLYVNLLIDIVEFCDCAPMSGVPVVPDIGFLMSNDPVAVDNACIELIDKVWKEEGRVKKEEGCLHDAWDKKKQDPQIKYAESIGLGSRKYKLIEI